jgi:NADP-dependent aldehyde dehydrogenase
MNGHSLVGSQELSGNDEFRAVEAASGEPLEPVFGGVGAAEVNAACVLTAQAFDRFRNLDPGVRADFLVAIADEITALGDELIDRAMRETGLPRPRLLGERGRTTGQLQMFAALLRVHRIAVWRSGVGQAMVHGKGLHHPDSPGFTRPALGWCSVRRR